MLDSCEENELIWDESDTRLSGFVNNNLLTTRRSVTPTSSSDSISITSCKSATTTATSISKATTTTATLSTANSSLDKSLSICFSDISNPSDSDYLNFNYNRTNGANSNNCDDDDELNLNVTLKFDYREDVDLNGHGSLITQLTSTTPKTPISPSLYSYTGDGRKSKSVGNLKDLDRELRAVASANRQLAKWRDDTINCVTPKRTGYRVTFEIISAQTVTSRSSSGVKNKYVSYTIIIKRCPGLESQPGVIERRYSEFSSLYMGLMKRFPILLRDFDFPKKTLIGNFSSQVIRERSIAFQSFLTYCLSVDELRTSRQFVDFLHHKEMMEVRRLLKSRSYEDAGNILENCYFVHEKIALQEADGQSNAQIFHILILLVGSMKAANSPLEALKYAEKAAPFILESDSYDRHELIVPFIRTVIQLFECYGKPTDALERKLVKLKEKGVKIDKTLQLIDAIVKKDYTSLSSLKLSLTIN